MFKTEELPIMLVLNEGESILTPQLPPSRIMPRAESETCTAGTANLCEKPASSAKMTVPIVLGVAIPLVAIIGVLVYLHRRSTLRLRQEENNDPHKSLDFGMGEGKKRKSAFFGANKEKDPRHRVQLSMDMNLSSPYLLPPQAQGSRDSLHSLARSLKKDGDPYGAVDDASSIKSGRPGFQRKTTDGFSEYAASSRPTSARYSPYYNGSLRQNPMPQVTHSMPSSPLANSQKNPFDSPRHCDDALPSMPSLPSAVATPQGQPSTHPKQNTICLPVTQSNPTISPGDSIDKREQISSEPQILQAPMPTAVPDQGLASQQPVLGNGFDFGLDIQASPQYVEPSFSSSEVNIKSPPASAQPPKEDNSVDLPADIPEPSPLCKTSFQDHPPTRGQVQKEDGSLSQDKDSKYNDEYTSRDRQQSRKSNNVGQDDGLTLPQQDNKRLSVGFRPLPPNEVLETEDPERRADRIRSFYKEYFDDSKRESIVPPIPIMPFQSNRDTKGASYYEDNDQDYMGESAFFDPNSNSFVMPYAAPVTRRAMTPPPRGRVPGGPFRGPRPHASSIGGMSLPGGQAPPRAGSSMSGSIHGGPKFPGSAPGSRTGSRAPMNRKPMSPPAALNTLPTPSKLKDDSFLNGIDFAPPESFADRAAGRSQSPVGERKPYQLRVPVSSPLSSSYDDMAALPSPHLLRKSGTFTGLDFAPPKRFKDADQMSDAGSIRSNRTGISAANSHAIRSGAGRVSRLPGDTVFSQANLDQQLKPQWGMRP